MLDSVASASSPLTVEAVEDQFAAVSSNETDGLASTTVTVAASDFEPTENNLPVPAQTPSRLPLLVVAALMFLATVAYVVYRMKQRLSSR